MRNVHDSYFFLILHKKREEYEIFKLNLDYIKMSSN